MSLFKSLLGGGGKNTANVAKERLQVIIARERGSGNGPDYLPQLQEEILALVRKYVEVDDDAVRMEIDRDGNREILELNVTLPDPE